MQLLLRGVGEYWSILLLDKNSILVYVIFNFLCNTPSIVQLEYIYKVDGTT